MPGTPRLARRPGLGDATSIGTGSMLGARVFVACAPAAAQAGPWLLVSLLLVVVLLLVVPVLAFVVQVGLDAPTVPATAIEFDGPGVLAAGPVPPLVGRARWVGGPGRRGAVAVDRAAPGILTCGDLDLWGS